jgi:hypothetical protein
MSRELGIRTIFEGLNKSAGGSFAKATEECNARVGISIQIFDYKTHLSS